MLDPHLPLPFTAAVHPEARAARRLTWDSREAGPAVAFVALPGERTHGNAFVEQALAAGAPFVLTDLDVPRAVRMLMGDGSAVVRTMRDTRTLTVRENSSVYLLSPLRQAIT
jgi:UDP-N-acetylmuramoyl-tripeptide--D-alanyl-D-alanine ligase